MEKKSTKIAYFVALGVFIVLLVVLGISYKDAPILIEGAATPFAGTFWSLLPPIVAIVLALISKEVYSSLFLGCLVGALLVSNFRPWETLVQLVEGDNGIVTTVSDAGNIAIIVFLVVLGIMVDLMNKTGGSEAFGRWAKKTVKTQLGEVDIKVPRDRNGSFEPKIIGKYDRNADGMEDKILALYACGMSQRDIAEQVKELYGVEISPELVTKISEKIMPEVTAWQNRPLEPVYPFVFMDAIHYKVREDRRYVTKAAYVVLGVTMDGRKDILGVWIGEHENSKFWLNVLNDLKSRGVLDVYLFCTDGLCGMMQAIEAVFPKSRLQRCIVHQVRSSTRYVSYKDIKKVVADLKKIYSAVTLEEAEKNLQAFAEAWRKQYPSCVKSWEENWPVLSTFFEYPVEIRKIIYTTNIIEGLNRQFRQITKNKPSFMNDDSLRRMLYLASQRIVKHWHARY